MITMVLLSWEALLGLVCVLIFKSAMEELWLLEIHPSYEEYRLTTWRFVPGLL
jgi:protein-S-isoprenylcysteine O-methyltransferase Ste14